jgi:uncharacterized protein YbjT (DUF2867 family)
VFAGRALWYKIKHMKIIVTGSLGNISKPLTQTLVAQGHKVTVISSKADKTTAIEALGATAAIGSLEDVAFLTGTFKGADVVYCMTPSNYYHDQTLEPIAYTKNLGVNYAEAIRASGVTRIIHLSSFGGELATGTGFILGAHEVEQIFAGLPAHTHITTMRPTSFYYNFLGFIPVIKHTGMIVSNYGAADIVPIVSPLDIADAIVDEIRHPAAGRKVRYVASEELTGNEIARILGAAIGKPALVWKVISNDEQYARFQQAGFNAHTAALFVELGDSLHTGRLAEDYNKHKPEFGKVKLADFAKEFASAYHQS